MSIEIKPICENKIILTKKEYSDFTLALTKNGEICSPNSLSVAIFAKLMNIEIEGICPDYVAPCEKTDQKCNNEKYSYCKSCNHLAQN